jgi:hypothetical protein
MYTPKTDRSPDDAIMHTVTAIRTTHAGWSREEEPEGGAMGLR